MISWEEIGHYVSQKRMAHVRGCAECAEKLAQKWGADTRSARLAAMLHDITKDKPLDWHLKTCGDYGILLSPLEKEGVNLLHAITGSVEAKVRWCAPEEVCSAVRWHTTGRAGMTVLEKIIYLADIIEVTRRFDGIEHIRALAFEDLDGAVLAALISSESDLERKGKLFHPASREALLELSKRKNGV